ncbi:EamA family transporter [Thioclava sp. JM3]|uniref:DMT family transporter n=1 Tax=Thioclava sp. JM3 TaxID=1973004 RepID=UPI000B53B119|nr:DMT family transporter [Thioclava sp. JM3]OWY15806.1 EamA family transporter [Thioclava sp. JM3]
MENLRGSVLMVIAMAAFAMEDMFVKSASTHLAVGVVLMLFGLGGMAVFGVLITARGQRLLHPALASKPLLIKLALEVVGRLGYTLGIALTPLSNASAILQATPLVVVAGAAVVFSERVGIRRWVAVGIGFIGVLIVLRPGLEGFVPAALWTVLGMLGFAGRDLATRACPPVLSNFQLSFYGFMMLIPTGVLILLIFGGVTTPDLVSLRDVAGAVAFGSLAYWSLTKAMRMGEVSVITPFRYTRLIFALILGAVVFGERPDTAMIFGAALIVASGLYTLVEGRRSRIRARVRA